MLTFVRTSIFMTGEILARSESRTPGSKIKYLDTKFDLERKQKMNNRLDSGGGGTNGSRSKMGKFRNNEGLGILLINQQYWNI